MNASKEECRKAQAALDKLTRLDANIAAYEQISTFLQAAERKLPSEASYGRYPCPKCLNNGVMPLAPLYKKGQIWECKNCETTFSEQERLNWPHEERQMPKSKHKEGPSGWGETKETGL